MSSRQAKLQGFECGQVAEGHLWAGLGGAGTPEGTLLLAWGLPSFESAPVCFKLVPHAPMLLWGWGEYILLNGNSKRNENSYIQDGKSAHVKKKSNRLPCPGPLRLQSFLISATDPTPDPDNPTLVFPTPQPTFFRGKPTT